MCDIASFVPSDTGNHILHKNNRCLHELLEHDIKDFVLLDSDGNNEDIETCLVLLLEFLSQLVCLGLFLQENIQVWHRFHPQLLHQNHRELHYEIQHCPQHQNYLGLSPRSPPPPLLWSVSVQNCWLVPP